MLTGRQIREARLLLGWGRIRFSRRARLTIDFVAAIESSDGEAWLTAVQERSIRQAFAEAGVELTPDGARLRVQT